MKQPKPMHQAASARAGTRCWCGTAATVTRTAPGVVSHYCTRHWMLWWTLEMSASVGVRVEIAGPESA